MTSRPLAWEVDGSAHDFGHPEADNLRVESYTNGFLEFTAVDGGMSNGEQVSYTLDWEDSRRLLGIVIDHLLRSAGPGDGCILAGHKLPEGIACPFCTELQATASEVSG